MAKAVVEIRFSRCGRPELGELCADSARWDGLLNPKKLQPKWQTRGTGEGMEEWGNRRPN